MKRAIRVNAFTGLLDGGAAAGAIRLHQALRQTGIESKLYYPSRFSAPKKAIEGSFAAPFAWQLPKDVARFISFRSHRVKFKRALRGRSDQFEIFTSPQGATASRWPSKVGKPDTQQQEIFHLHWVSKFLDWQTFFESLPAKSPVVWTLHDMNPFTGGCHFSGPCQRYQMGCGKCPQLPSNDQCEGNTGEDLSHQFFDSKRKTLKNQVVDVVAPSRWMLGEAQSSLVFPAQTRFHHIPYGIPINDYFPIAQREARTALNLDQDAFVFLFGAAQLNKERKGIKELLSALPALNHLKRKVVGLFFGAGNLGISEVDGDLPEVRSLGYVREVSEQRMMYSAADAFVLPSLEDNLPFTGLESIACGTPVIGFDVGGIPDYVIPQKTGLLAEAGSVPELASCLCSLCNHFDFAQSMRPRAREFAVAHHNIDREAANYAALYAAVLDNSISDC